MIVADVRPKQRVRLAPKHEATRGQTREIVPRPVRIRLALGCATSGRNQARIERLWWLVCIARLQFAWTLLARANYFAHAS